MTNLAFNELIIHSCLKELPNDPNSCRETLNHTCITLKPPTPFYLIGDYINSKTLPYKEKSGE